MRAEITEAMPADMLVAAMGDRAERATVIVPGFAYWW